MIDTYLYRSINMYVKLLIKVFRSVQLLIFVDFSLISFNLKKKLIFQHFLHYF